VSSTDDRERCYLAAMRILQYRFNSEAELRRKLRAKGFDAELIAGALERLKNEKWLDDERFAAAFTRTRTSKKIGPKRILRELHAAGVANEAAAQAIAENVDEAAVREALQQLCERRVRQLARRHGPEYLATPEGRNKLTVYLLNQGYDAGLVYETVKEIRFADDQSDS
jgi:regulatory protein